MMRITLATLAAFGMIAFAGCKPEEEPFEYPETTITQPVTEYHTTRLAGEFEVWQQQNIAEGCLGDFTPETFASTEVNTTRGFASLYLVPNASSCSTYAAVSTIFSANEVASSYWDNWMFEMAFSELQVNPETKFRVALNYREVALDVDLAPYMRETIAGDTQVVDISGLLTVRFESGEVYMALNEFELDLEWEGGSGNTLVTDASGQESSFGLSAEASATESRSLIVITLLRASSYGIPED